MKVIESKRDCSLVAIEIAFIPPTVPVHDPTGRRIPIKLFFYSRVNFVAKCQFPGRTQFNKSR